MSLSLFRARYRGTEGRIVTQLEKEKRKKVMDRSNLNGFVQKVIKVRDEYLINRFVSLYLLSLPSLPPFNHLFSIILLQLIETKQTTFSLHFKMFLNVLTFSASFPFVHEILFTAQKYHNVVGIFCTLLFSRCISNHNNKKKKTYIYKCNLISK